MAIGDCDINLATYLVHKGFLKAAFINVISEAKALTKQQQLTLLDQVQKVAVNLSASHARDSRFGDTHQKLELMIDPAGQSRPHILGKFVETHPELPTWLYKNAADQFKAMEKIAGTPDFSRIRAVSPNSQLPQFIEKFHKHGLTYSFGIYGETPEWIIGELSEDEESAILECNNKTLPQEFRHRIRNIPSQKLAIFSEKFIHKSSVKAPKIGQLVIETFQL